MSKEIPYGAASYNYSSVSKNTRHRSALSLLKPYRQYKAIGEADLYEEVKKLKAEHGQATIKEK